MKGEDTNARNMGKKGSWFSAIKRVFIPHSKEKLADVKTIQEPEKNSTKEKNKKKGLRKLRHGDTNSFISFFREPKPSSIEKILDEAEREHNLIFRPPTPEHPQTPPFVPQRVPSPRVPSPRASFQRLASPKAASPRVASPKVASPRAASPRVASPRISQHRSEISYRPEPTLRYRHASATKIQAAYRGYTARRSFRALKGLVRLQGVVRGQHVKRQTSNAMKYMQLSVRVQSQIQLRRIHMLENQARRQSQYRNDKEVESNLGKWNMSQTSEAGNGDWDDSVLTKGEVEARLEKKVEAVVKRERAMAYAYSHKLWKANPNSNLKPQTDIRSGGFPWWWNWIERSLPPSNPPESQAIKKFQLTSPSPHSELKRSPRLGGSSTNKNNQFGFENTDATPTPRSTKSMIFPAARPARTPPPYRISHNSPSLSKYSRARGSGADSPFNFPMKDTDSLTSCPPFSVPNYMAPTASAKAKVKASPSSSCESKRRSSFPLTQGIGSSFKWNKFSSKDSTGSHGILDLSIDSTVSMPAGVGRKQFNRFV
ncbi:protein IQ-DOMAIN 14-like isoform X2 [Tripterygium wilfordii]|uniref:protein IQ-DOMAIN 14-like isoform X2 n=1 Tax=Tripterygium wilfordii TaxID=458696 RepID=UPI0018F81C5B|nr:protein IQ-DOMAIN 14-like isoform X2 [Tripterygium wilfordii]XP_038679853.1 protein IQ-DOMAIN 14-like isoform X2 [Tripterygium wilfordii]